MPLYADGLKKIRGNLLTVQSGLRPKAVKVGFFTGEQIASINTARKDQGFPELSPQIVFHGKHLYDSRCVRNGYTIDEVLEQIENAFSEDSVVEFTPPSSILRNPKARVDRQGRMVNDEVVFECTGRHPYADLYSVIPRGDGRRPAKK